MPEQENKLIKERKRIMDFLDQQQNAMTHAQWKQSGEDLARGGNAWNRYGLAQKYNHAAIAWYQHIHKAGSAREWRPPTIMRAVKLAATPHTLATYRDFELYATEITEALSYQASWMRHYLANEKQPDDLRPMTSADIKRGTIVWYGNAWHPELEGNCNGEGWCWRIVIARINTTTYKDEWGETWDIEDDYVSDSYPKPPQRHYEKD